MRQVEQDRLKVSMTKSTGAYGGFFLEMVDFLKWWIFERNESLRRKKEEEKAEKVEILISVPSILDFLHA